MTVVTTAPSYLFWRCAPPELRVPRAMFAAIGGAAACTVAVGPHGSATPETALRKLGVDVVMRGECEEVITALADAADQRSVPATALLRRRRVRRDTGRPQAARFTDLPALRWPDAWVARHHHHHHRFDARRTVPAPKSKHRAAAPTPALSAPSSTIATATGGGSSAPAGRNRRADRAGRSLSLFHRRDFSAATTAARSARRARRRLRDADADRPLEARDDRAARCAGCVSIEAGVESLTEEGRDCSTRMPDEHGRIGRATDPGAPPCAVRSGEPIATADDDPALVERWRERLRGKACGRTIRCRSIRTRVRRITGGSGASRTNAHGSGHTRTICPSSGISATSRNRSHCRFRSWRRNVCGLTPGRPARVLLSTDAVGGVWSYTIDLARGLADRGIEPVMAVLGPPPTEDKVQQAQHYSACAWSRPACRSTGRRERRTRLCARRNWPPLLERPALIVCICIRHRLRGVRCTVPLSPWLIPVSRPGGAPSRQGRFPPTSNGVPGS